MPPFTKRNWRSLRDLIIVYLNIYYFTNLIQNIRNLLIGDFNENINPKF